MKNEPVNFCDEMLNKSISINGKPYRLVPVEAELTLEDCVKRNRFVHCDPFNAIGNYPTEAIAEKVLLYGLLQSVANKLNEAIVCDQQYIIVLRNGKLEVIEYNGVRTSDPMFYSRGWADQAISIFAKSKFDLKKLYQ